MFGHAPEQCSKGKSSKKTHLAKVLDCVAGAVEDPVEPVGEEVPGEHDGLHHPEHAGGQGAHCGGFASMAVCTRW